MNWCYFRDTSQPARRRTLAYRVRCPPSIYSPGSSLNESHNRYIVTQFSSPPARIPSWLFDFYPLWIFWYYSPAAFSDPTAVYMTDILLRTVLGVDSQCTHYLDNSAIFSIISTEIQFKFRIEWLSDEDVGFIPVRRSLHWICGCIHLAKWQQFLCSPNWSITIVFSVRLDIPWLPAPTHVHTLGMILPRISRWAHPWRPRWFATRPFWHPLSPKPGIDRLTSTCPSPNLDDHSPRCTRGLRWANDTPLYRMNVELQSQATSYWGLFELHGCHFGFLVQTNDARVTLEWRPPDAYSHHTPSTVNDSSNIDLLAIRGGIQLTLLHFVPNTICRLLSHCEQNTLLMLPSVMGLSLNMSCVKMCRLAYEWATERTSFMLNSRDRT